MYQEERLTAILQYLQQHHRISVQEVVEQFGVSRDTARRDIVKLEEQGEILRTRGGAILPSLSKKSFSHQERMQLDLTGKRRIAQAAARLIKHGDYLLLDASTTVQLTVESLQTKDHVIITNSLATAASVSRKEGVLVKMLGGDVNPQDQCVHGTRTVENLANYHVDKLLVGACGLTTSGLVSPDEDHGYVIREMMKRADQVIILADHSKFGKSMLYRVASLDQIDLIVTDRAPGREMAEALDKSEVDVLVAAENGKDA
ncbi:DeoR/GlpR family DNA-binding transcription regulator [Brevibacillus parabrevis]|uniref:DeoR/GlpR family DNA-binding transcription regulator n=1 Tax=Brevibacillus parabrevis TaxID=54914 RepID=UPI0028D04FE2|nr:DeoR/GlpR family DNA-binding transcription regulator [Brevibacillus parabrevis]MED1721777.1 DeoR/GlpR family DNA-binding transcription regulator [Brevibacillus parabrevis]